MDATASRPPDQRYSKLHFIPEFAKHIKGKTPAQVLQSVRDVLGEYKTSARKNGQAVTLYYETWTNVDVVPVAQSVDAQNNVTH